MKITTRAEQQQVAKAARKVGGYRELVAMAGNLIPCTCGRAPIGWSARGSIAGVYHRSTCPARIEFEKRRSAK